MVLNLFLNIKVLNFNFEQAAEYHNNRINHADQVALVKDILQFIYNKFITLEKKIPSLFCPVESNTSAPGFLGILQERDGIMIYIPEA